MRLLPRPATPAVVLQTDTAWDRCHRRSGTLRRVTAELERTGGRRLPWDSTTAADFEDPEDLLRALHGLWSRRLAAAVDTALEMDPGDVRSAVVRAWRRLADLMPGVRAVLDRYAGHPAIRHQERVEHRMLAVAAGLAALADPWPRSAAIGAELEREARGTSRRC